MKIEHGAIRVDDVENMRQFYISYFGLVSREPYVNPAGNDTAYFLTFGEHKARLELMHSPDSTDASGKRGFAKGIAHPAISVGSKEAVNKLTEQLRADNYNIESEPETTGDGY